MSIFGIYALICTFLLLVYYMVLIWFDLHGSKGSKKEEAETIFTDDMVDTEASTTVEELAGGGYRLGYSDDGELQEEEAQEEEVTVIPDDQSEPAPGASSDVPAGDNGEGNDASEDGPSYDQAMKVHNESMNEVTHSHQMRCEGAEMMAMMTAPIQQKNRLQRTRTAC